MGLVVCSLEPWDEVWRRNQLLVDQLLRRQRLRQVAPRADAQRGLDQLGLQVPRVDDDAAAAGVPHQLRHLLLVGLRLREAVVEHDVDDILNRLVGVDLGHDHPIAVTIEDLGHAQDDDVVVVDERHRDGGRSARGRRSGHTEP